MPVYFAGQRCHTWSTESSGAHVLASTVDALRPVTEYGTFVERCPTSSARHNTHWSSSARSEGTAIVCTAGAGSTSGTGAHTDQTLMLGDERGRVFRKTVNQLVA